MNNRNTKRLNSKNSIANKPGMIIGFIAIIWIALLIDMIFVAHNQLFIIIAVSIGVWAVGLIMLKPGQLAVDIQKNGFWRTLFRKGSNNKRGRRRR
ncbi:hypothetical protein [Lactobacillus rizhaonensis]|uniref:hypothetical protein n=1 Tax=Lactobacillus rizhaonensis TaxID=3082863 RepID=UPI0025DB2AE3|nr:hypothetical protein [uncultured Lactobacillus sp.]